jgi:hypothetical protein
VLCNVKRFDRGPGTHFTITDEPYASALANIDGLATATDNATYRGVRFGRKLQNKHVIYLRKPEGYGYDSPEWQAVLKTGVGALNFDDTYLASILAASQAIDDVIASAVPVKTTYPCRGRKDGCGAQVAHNGDYCPSCQHDEY